MIKRTLAAVAAALCLGAAHAATEWTQYQGNASHTGSLDITVDTTFTKSWSLDIGAINPVAAVNGMVYASTQGYFSGQKLLALDAATGQQVWSKDFGGVYSVNPPSYAGGTVYLQTGNHSSDSWFRGYDALTGQLVAKAPFSAQWERYQAPTIVDDVAYVNGGGYGGAYAFDLKTGEQKWFTGLPQYDGWTPAVDDTRVVAHMAGSLYVMDRETGTIQQTIKDSSYSWSGYTASPSPILVGDMAYVVSSGYLRQFDLSAGVQTWALSGVVGQAAIDGDEIFALRNGTLSSINAATGVTNWMWEDPMTSQFGNEVLVTDNLVFVSGSSGKSFAIDRKTRDVVATFSESGRFSFGNDTLYIAGSHGLSAYSVAVVPEPGTVMLMLGGLMVCGVAMRRR